MDASSKTVKSLRPFVPAKDFELSKRYYRALGFSVVHEDPHVAGFELGSHAFLLQNFYVKEFADNYMMHMIVSDIDAWWTFVAALDLPGNFGVPESQPPKSDAIFRVFHLIDPTGVLWHVAQHLPMAGDA